MSTTLGCSFPPAKRLHLNRVSSGFPFPLPWYYVLANIYLIFQAVVSLIVSSRVRMLASTRKEHGITATTRGYVEKTLYITPALPEIDFPLIMPKNITACGPILLPEIPVSESDPELTAWLQKRPTVLVNLGSLAASDASSTRELAIGLRIVLEQCADLQVLWKLTSDRYSDECLGQILSRELNEGRVRIVNWLVADPLAILQSGHVVCSVHHGGANSYYEATAYVFGPFVSFPPFFTCCFLLFLIFFTASTHQGTVVFALSTVFALNSFSDLPQTPSSTPFTLSPSHTLLCATLPS